MEHSAVDSAVRAMQATNERDRPGHIEVLGIDVIPESERHGRPFELLWVWGASNIVITYIVGGAILIGLGLSFWQAVVVALISGIFFIPIGLASLPGPQAGTATMVVSRSAFGLRGNFAPALLSWFTVVGWEAVNLVLGAFALFALVQSFGVTPTLPIKALLFAVIVIATYTVAILGHATIVYLQKFFTYALGVLMIGVLIQVLPRAHISAPSGPLATSSTAGTMVLGIMILSAFSIGWTNYASDYTRYLRRQSSRRAIVLWTTLGGILPYLAITLIGILAATAANLSDPIGGLKPLLASWYFVPFVIAVIGGTLSNNFLNTYTSGLTLLALGIRVSRWKTIPLDGVVATAAAVYAMFFHDFTSTFINFLSLQIVWLAPWCAVYLTDMWLTHNSYSGIDLLSKRGGRYWFWHGVNVPGAAAWAAGILVALLFTNSTLWQGPIAQHLLGGADISVPAGAAVSIAIYAALWRRRYRGVDEGPAVGVLSEKVVSP